MLNKAYALSYTLVGGAMEVCSASIQFVGQNNAMTRSLSHESGVTNRCYTQCLQYYTLTTECLSRSTINKSSE